MRDGCACIDVRHRILRKYHWPRARPFPVQLSARLGSV